MPSRALRWVRKSKGRDDAVGLEDQREGTRSLAEELADEVDTLDLGIHTGFSIHSRERDEPRIDANPDVMAALDRLEAGEYDYLIAWDDTRLARDEFFATVERACKLGDAEICYVADVTDDPMVFGVQRTVAREQKLKEMRQSARALRRRRENGFDEGRPKWGTEYDADHRYLVPDEDFGDALKAIAMRDVRDEDGNHAYSYRAIIDATAIPSTGTLSRILDRRNWYLSLAREHGYVEPDQIDNLSDYMQLALNTEADVSELDHAAVFKGGDSGVAR